MVEREPSGGIQRCFAPDSVKPIRPSWAMTDCEPNSPHYELQFIIMVMIFFFFFFFWKKGRLIFYSAIASEYFRSEMSLSFFLFQRLTWVVNRIRCLSARVECYHVFRRDS